MPMTGVWISVDPLAEKYMNVSSYVYCLNNPVKYVDPDGRSTNVVDNGNGKYTVVGGDLKNKKDLNVYIVDSKDHSKRLGQLGKSASLTSFYNDDAQAFMGTIDPKDDSGKNFLNKALHNTPTMGDYMANANNGQEYDFKSSNGTKKQIYDNPSDYYRGMSLGVDKDGQTVYSSAREIGNIVAGFIAGANDMTWSASRVAFDALQSKKNHRLSSEGIPTQTGEAIGWKLGNSLSPQVKFSNFLRSSPSTFRYGCGVIINMFKK